MKKQTKLSKMQNLILYNIYREYNKHPMIKNWNDIKTVNGHIQWETKNRWREGLNGSMRVTKLSRAISKQMVNKSCTFDRKNKAKEHYQKYKENGDTHELLLANFIQKMSSSQKYKSKTEYQTNSFRASISRSLKRLYKRGLIELGTRNETNYNFGIMLTPDGEKIARKIKFSECLSKKRLTPLEVVK